MDRSVNIVRRMLLVSLFLLGTTSASFYLHSNENTSDETLARNFAFFTGIAHAKENNSIEAQQKLEICELVSYLANLEPLKK